MRADKPAILPASLGRTITPPAAAVALGTEAMPSTAPVGR
jgi:hypothetical protein